MPTAAANLNSALREKQLPSTLIPAPHWENPSMLAFGRAING
jgi:hypothetical protein